MKDDDVHRAVVAGARARARAQELMRTCVELRKQGDALRESVVEQLDRAKRYCDEKTRKAVRAKGVYARGGGAARKMLNELRRDCGTAS
jgi:hypothetical protein